MVKLLRAIIVDLIMNNSSKKANILDDFVTHSSSVLLKLLYEYFAIKDYIDPKAWDIKEIDWNKIIEF